MSERHVLDASALLRLFFREPAAERVDAVPASSCIGAVSYSGAVAKMVDLGVPTARMFEFVADLQLEAVPLDRNPAELAGTLRADTRAAGLSLGDRCRLALARSTDAIALTADRAWAKLAVGVRIEMLR